ncbi:MAG: ABC transporter ATP-binding protein [Acidimicrobiaceae bacterium]|jgi:oligopeptide/dipeptide ABC transporter ATP-binding protein
MSLLEIKGLTVDAATSTGQQRIIDDIHLSIGKGEIIGIVGESGSGKTTLARALVGLLDKNLRVSAGECSFDDEVIISDKVDLANTIRGKKIGMVFQDAGRSLNPLMKVKAQIKEVLRVNRPEITKEDIKAVMHEILQRMEIDDPDRVLNSFPHQLSGGQRQRVAIAIAIVTSPSLVIADECTTALDVTTQAEVVHLLRELVRDGKTSLLFITHDLLLASELCDRVMVMYASEAVEIGPVSDVLEMPNHPYTKALIASVPSWDVTGPLKGIPGSAPKIGLENVGCNFADRCSYSEPGCFAENVSWTSTSQMSGFRCRIPLRKLSSDDIQN